MNEALPLSGHSAVITGGGRGIGETVARQLAAAGANIVVAARSQNEIEAVAASLREAGHQALAVTCDVGDPQQVQALRTAAEEALGTIGIVVNNAGIATSAPLVKETFEQWQLIQRVNSTGVFLVTREFMPPMLDAGWGRVVNVASVAGKFGAPYISAYCASKHAVIGFTRAVAVEVATSGVTVNAVCPGYVDTEMTVTSVETIVGKTGISEEKARRVLEKMSPQNRIFTAEEVAAQVVHLCHPLSAGINGQSIVLDGGAFQA